MLELKSGPGWTGVGQHGAGFFFTFSWPSMLRPGRRRCWRREGGREEVWDGIGGTWVTKGAVKTNSGEAIASGEV